MESSGIGGVIAANGTDGPALGGSIAEQAAADWPKNAPQPVGPCDTCTGSRKDYVMAYKNKVQMAADQITVPALGSGSNIGYGAEAALQNEADTNVHADLDSMVTAGAINARDNTVGEALRQGWDPGAANQLGRQVYDNVMGVASFY